jgi:hypothetical protein
MTDRRVLRSLDRSGIYGIDGLDVGNPVTAEQMRALFGCELHPLAELRLQQLEGPDLTGQDFQDVGYRRREPLGGPSEGADLYVVPAGVGQSRVSGD